jgi:hypothetical protein
MPQEAQYERVYASGEPPQTRMPEPFLALRRLQRELQIVSDDRVVADPIALIKSSSGRAAMPRSSTACR